MGAQRCWAWGANRAVILLWAGLLFGASRSQGDEPVDDPDNLPRWTSPHAYVAFCAVVRNEHGNMAEWVQYHNWIGVDKFYIFDHRSSPPLATELAPFMSSGLVEYHYFNDSWRHDVAFYQSPSRQFLSPQGWAYDNCFR